MRRGPGWRGRALAGVLAALVILALAALWVRSTPRDSAQIESPGGATPAELDDFVRDRADQLRLPGVAVVVLRNGVPFYTGYFGVDGTGRAVAGDTRFVLGSTSKQFTGLAVQRLISEGRISLDTRVSEILPELASSGIGTSAVTVRQLLGQTSGFSTTTGLRQWGWWVGRPQSIQANAQALGGEDLDRPSGTTFVYSNANYDLLGAIVERVTGQTFAAALKDLVLSPLGLDHTSADPAKAAQAPGYQTWLNLLTVPTASPDTPGAVPSAMMTSTAEDLTRLLQGHLQSAGTPFGRDVLQASRTPLTKADEYSRYASGWFVRPLWEEHPLNADWSNPSLPPCITHDGNAYRSMSFLLACPSTGLGVVALTDVGAGGDSARWGQFQDDLIHHVLGTAAAPSEGDPVRVHTGVVLIGSLSLQLLTLALLVVAVIRRRRYRVRAIQAGLVSLAAVGLTWVYAPNAEGHFTPIPAMWAVVPDLGLVTVVSTALAVAVPIVTLAAARRRRGQA
ncbi:MAG: serine hydrolase domain-containing protein [Propionicimonas sp.]